MGPGLTPSPPCRAWTITIDTRHGAPALTCTACGPLTQHRAAAVRSAVLAHLACHIRSTLLPPYLRICQCGQHDCRWHARHRGCNGPLLLLLARSATGYVWRLADVCRACAVVTPHAAVVADTLAVMLPQASPPTTVSGSPPGQGEGAAAGKDVVYVYDLAGHDIWQNEQNDGASGT